MDPVSQFKFACPNCSQHLQARPHETGRITECPSCFKKLVVPQAPTSGGGNLMIAAALAESRRVPTAPASRAPAGANKPVSKGLRIYLALALVTLVVAAAGVAFLKSGWQSTATSRDANSIELWTDHFDNLQLLDIPVTGQLNGWDFEATQEVWKDTKLIIRQDGGIPKGLRLEITFPLKGGELIPGKHYQLRDDNPPFTAPIRILWKDEQGGNQSRSCPSGYLLSVRFEEVSSEEVTGRIHLCLPDPTHSWVAGSFKAKVKTVVK